MDSSLRNHRQDLCYYFPYHKEWDIVKFIMLVPEVCALFVCPSGCGRYAGINALQSKEKKNFYYLCINENDIIEGNYENLILDAVDEIMNSSKVKPKFMLLFSTCVDNFIGTDYDSVILNLKNKYNIPFCLCHMDPICLGTKLAPPLSVQNSIYSLLEKSEVKSNTVNLVGDFVPLDEGSELNKFLSKVGINKVNHISEFSKFEDFKKMSQAKLNIVTIPEGIMAAKNMREKLGIPFCFLPTSFNISTIEMQYKKLEQITNSTYDLSSYKEAALTKIKFAKDIIKNTPIVLDSGALCRPFDTAKALISYGFNVNKVYANVVPEYEKEALNWLSKNELNVEFHKTNSHLDVIKANNKSEDMIAIGFESGYLSNVSKVVEITPDGGIFGYTGIIKLMEKMVNVYIGGEET